jgi:hypothetical protein
MHKKIAVMRQYQLEVLRRAFREDTVDGRNYLLRQRTQSYICFDAGDEYLHAGDYRSALRSLLQAILLWPFNYRYYRYLIHAIARTPVVAQSSITK